MACSCPHSGQEKKPEHTPRSSNRTSHVHPTEWWRRVQPGGDARIWELSLPPRALWWDFPEGGVRVSGWRSFTFLCESSKRNRLYGSQKGPEQCFSTSCIWARPQLRDSKSIRTQTTWFRRRQSHLTIHSKNQSAFCPVKFWILIDFFSIFQNLQKEQLYILNWHLSNDMAFVLTGYKSFMLVCKLLC